jgi:tRNA-splicing ligase RtcB
MAEQFTKQEFRRVEDYVYELPAGARPFMRVPARIYADDVILEDALGDQSVIQLANTASLPGIIRYTMAMPDVHQGYGFPIGGVAATELPSGVISPGGIGYDINCGTRLALSTATQEEIQPHLERLVEVLFRTVPTGVGKGGEVRLTDRDMEDVLENGARWAVRKGYGHKADLEHAEEHGAMADADPGAVSPRAKKRGQDQLGTLGSGNHFVEVQVVDEIFDAEVAEVFGLREGLIAVQIHSGSRGLGHQVCTDYVKELQSALQKYKIHVPDRELVCAPLDSPEGREYFGAMAAAANYAWANRQCLMHLVRQAFEKALKGQVKDTRLTLLYDVAHNIGKIETHMVGGREVQVCVHRKGATRAFGPDRPEVPRDFRAVGQPVLIPGDMGTGSYVLVGTQRAMETTFGSTCHGAGRLLSRHAALRETRGETVVAELRQKGIVVRGASMKGLAEEAPGAYKDIDRVVNVVHRAGIARKVARLRPLGVIKG